MFAAVVVGFIGPLIDAIDWGKLAGGLVVLAAVPVLFEITRRIATRSVKADLANLTDRLKNAGDSLSNAQTANQVNAIELATRNQTIAFHERTISHLQAEAGKLKNYCGTLLDAGRRLSKELRDLRLMKVEYDRLREHRAADADKVRLLEDTALTTDEKVAALRRLLEEREKALERGERRMSKARRLEGYLLKAKALQARPRFKPLAERKRPIVSVLNLKGGVGKTTLTAHLGAALARKGYRVLLVDLDLQGSLTGLMLPPDAIHEQFTKKRLMQDFLLHAAKRPTVEASSLGTRPTPTLTPYIVPVPIALPGTSPSGRVGSLSIVPTSDSLAYAELNLTLGWLLKQGERDARFLLRKALHLKGANAAFDIVLLDCPPLLNISCVNALAASDYLLVPTLLSAKATERVPKLLNTVQRPEFVTHVNADLKVMGVVANRTRQAQPTGHEAVLWQTLPKMIQAGQSSPAKLFASVVAQDASITANEEQFVHPKPGSRAEQMIADLATEFEKELPDDCRIA